MVQLILLACLIAEPSRCETFDVRLEPTASLNQCLWQSQLQVAQWSADHPAWLVRKVRCGLEPT